MERGENLNDLDERAADLLDDAKEFESTTQKVENKFKCENAKMKIIIGIISIKTIRAKKYWWQMLATKRMLATNNFRKFLPLIRITSTSIELYCHQ